MARRVTWTEPAWADLEQAAAYLARSSVESGSALVSEAVRAAQSLAELADRGSRIEGLAVRDLRQLLIGQYRLIYRVSPDQVYVVAFVHGSRDLLALWRREGRDP